MASSAILLTVAAAFFYWELARNLETRDRNLLVSKVQVLQLLLRDHSGNLQVLKNEVEHEVLESALTYYLRIFDEPNSVRLETPGMKERLPISAFPESVNSLTGSIPTH